MRTTTWILCGVALSAMSACYSPSVPPTSPTKNPLDDAPPADTSATAASTAAGPNDVEAKKGKFDEGMARVELARATKNAHSCIAMAAKDDPRGDTTVTVTFSGVGKSTKATIPAPYDGTEIGKCATRAFVGIIIPPFEGDDVNLDYAVDLSPDAKEKNMTVETPPPGGAAPAKKKK
jgi:hypothetical protein